MAILDLVYFAAAAWYLAYAVTHKHGPFGVFERLREMGGGRWHGRSKPINQVTYDPNAPTIEGVPPNSRVIGVYATNDGLLDCIICLMPWLAILFLLIGHNLVIDAFAVAGVALWIHGYTGWRLKL